MKTTSVKAIIQQLIGYTNAFDVESALLLFAKDAVIDDESVGEKFNNTSGVTRYLKKFFVGYHTLSKIVSIDVIDKTQAKVQLDFTGDFGHETGALIVTLNKDGLIVTLEAYLD